MDLFAFWREPVSAVRDETAGLRFGLNASTTFVFVLFFSFLPCSSLSVSIHFLSLLERRDETTGFSLHIQYVLFCPCHNKEYTIYAISDFSL